jgi:class 3 adenylate cyclase
MAIHGERSSRPQTRYVEAAQGYLGYQVFGGGERDIVFLTGALSNVDAIWDEPSAARFFDRLGSIGRVINFDMRGSGVSDPILGSTTWQPVEEVVDDVLAVLDAAGSERTVVYGDTEGGLWAMMLAASAPQRVSALVLVNAAACFLRHHDYPIGIPPHAADALSEQYFAQHGTTGDMLELTAPSVADDARFRTWWTRYQRMSVPLGLAKSTFEWYRTVDVRAALPLISAPTLIVARRDARFHRPAYSEYLAEHIDGSELRLVDGADTLPFHAGNFEPTLDHVAEFLTGRREAPRIDRVLATVLFTDIVGSTARASALGDERWLDLLGDHDRIVRAEIERFRGREIKMTGDGCLATFDGPARAVTCAAAIAGRLAPIGLKIRAGIHTGEVEISSGDVHGLAVHIASRVMSQAVDRVVVSRTVRDLVVGSGIEFDDYGTFDLKGVPGAWQLYALRSLG